MASANRSSTQARPVVMRATRPRSGRTDGTIDEIETAAADGVRWLRAQVLDNPWPTLGAAAAAGWLLGGGLTPRLVGLLITTAGRLAVTDVVSAALRGATHADAPAASGADADA